MGIRLTASRDGTALRRATLGVGTYLAGSSPEADVVLDDPTVSRRHLELVVGDASVHVRDLGSSNGTTCRGVRLIPEASTDWPHDAPLLLGDIALNWSALAEGDEEVALSTGAASPAPQPGRRSPTLDIGTLNRFAAERLPDLLRRLREGATRQQLAREAGEAVMATTGCSALRILDRDRPGGEDHVLFAAQRPGDGPQAPIQATEDRLTLRLTPGSREAAVAYRPLVDTLLSLLSLAAPATVRASAPAAPAPRAETLDPAMRRIHDRAARAARGGLNVLIRGESGTGKEVLARYIHACADDGARPFVAVNCSALPENLLEAELFGIEKGVATGVDARAGKFEQAHGGILFLDEIGDMPAATQAKILRALQEESVVRLGATRARPARVMVICATNRDIDAMIAAGEFRLDLFHRLADWEVELPPLRERPVDIPNLALRFLSRAADRLETHVSGLSQRALDVLLGFEWPGNIRQLEREMKRLAAFADGDGPITSEDLDPRITAGPADTDQRLDARLAQAERRIIAAELQRHDHNVSRTAESLGVSRSRLYRRMEQLGLHAPSMADDAG